MPTLSQFCKNLAILFMAYSKQFFLGMKEKVDVRKQTFGFYFLLPWIFVLLLLIGTENWIHRDTYIWEKLGYSVTFHKKLAQGYSTQNKQFQ